MTDIELDSRERDLLDAYRDHHAMPAASRDRVWASLAGGVGPGGGGGSAIESASEPWLATGTGAAVASGWSRPSLVAAAGLLVAAGITLVVLGIGGSSKDDRAQPIAAIESGGGASAPAIDPEPEVEPAAAVRVAAPTSGEIPKETPAIEPVSSAKPKHRARTKTPAPEPIVDAPSPGRERELIEQAHAALAKGDTQAALKALDEHARDFAQGVFAEEREALDAIARCKSGDLERGRDLARTFLDAHPRAVLATRVRRSCDLEGSPSE
jgi:hypothetical protein